MDKKVRPDRGKPAKNPIMFWINIAAQRGNENAGNGVNNRLNDQNWQEIFTKNTDNRCQKQQIARHALSLRKDLKKRIVQKSLVLTTAFQYIAASSRSMASGLKSLMARFINRTTNATRKITMNEFGLCVGDKF